LSEVKFLLSYLIFLMFFVFLVTLGAPSFLPEEDRARLENITGSVPTEKPTSWWQSIPIIGPIYGFFLGVYQGLTVFWILLTVSSTVRWVSLIIVIPFVITMFYVIIKTLRG